LAVERAFRSPNPARIDNTLIKALARAYGWQKLLDNGTYASVAEIAKPEQINPSYVGRVLRLTLLAPDIVQAILDGSQPTALQIEALLKPMPLEWDRQHKVLAQHHASDAYVGAMESRSIRG
jgi:hypothetical protein